jgi:hypothetical protein
MSRWPTKRCKLHERHYNIDLSHRVRKGFIRFFIRFYTAISLAARSERSETFSAIASGRKHVPLVHTDRRKKFCTIHYTILESIAVFECTLFP